MCPVRSVTYVSGRSATATGSCGRHEAVARSGADPEKLHIGKIGKPGVEGGYAAVSSTLNRRAISAITSNASSASASVMSNEPA
jgi:hypothetical protein